MIDKDLMIFDVYQSHGFAGTSIMEIFIFKRRDDRNTKHHRANHKQNKGLNGTNLQYLLGQGMKSYQKILSRGVSGENRRKTLA